MALGFKYFTSFDPGAPQLQPGNSTLVNILDWVLDTSDPVNGWEIVYTATNKRVYRSRYGIRDYLRVDGTATPSGSLVRMYESMTDVDTGTDPYPTIAQAALNSARAAHSTASSGTSIFPYYGIKTARFFVLIRPRRTSPETPTGQADVFFAGEIPNLPNASGDPHLSVIGFVNTTNAPITTADSGPLSLNHMNQNAGPVGSTSGIGATTGTASVVLRRTRNGAVKSTIAMTGLPSLGVTISALPTTVDPTVGYQLLPWTLASPLNSASGTCGVLRGYIPNVYAMSVNPDTTWTVGDTFTDTQGRPYVYLRSVTSTAGAVLALGITDEHGAV